MKKYEIMYIVKADLDEAARKEEISKLHKILTDNGGKIVNVNEWGERELAYSIKKQNKGYYVVIKVEAEQKALSEFKRLSSIDVNMLRSLITVDAE
ncbi:MAG: 30S ribosomal protein S6 [Bacilli bacterium]